jgi:hypothetical protein
LLVRQSTIKLKTCSTCKEGKTLDQFYTRSNGSVRSTCKACCGKQTAAWRDANRDHYNTVSRQYRNTRAERIRHVSKRFGLTEAQYVAMEEQQEFACVVCRKPFSEMARQPHVDHCHKTGAVRGLLCSGCNQALGNAKDDPALLRALASYLETSC